jgi:hypothetical protein
MGTEIIIITIFQLLLLGYALAVYIVRFLVVKILGAQQYGFAHKINSVTVLFLSLGIIIWWFFAISGNYQFSLGYVLIIQFPLILITVRLLLPFSLWVSLTKSSSKDAASGA